MKQECYSCSGYEKNCKENISFSYERCRESILAEEDKKREERGNLQAIVGKQAFAEHLLSIGEKERALRVLPDY
jgi:hypothetical protein